MKRRMILALALSACLFGAGGCRSPVQEEPSDPGVSAPTQEQPIEELPSQSDVSAPSEPIPETPAQPEEPAQPLYEIPSGVWLAGTDLGYSNYYHFDAQEQSGSYVSLEYGLGMSFTYDGSGTELVFSLDNHEEPVTATLEPSGEEEFTLVWADSLPEKLTFVSEGSLDDFHFYSNDELARMAGEHYARLTEEEIPEQSGTLTNEDNTVTVQLYDDLGDHNSTAAWYIVDRFTATGTDVLTGEEIDLLAELPEEEAPTEATEPAETQEPATEVPELTGDVPVSEETVEVSTDESVPLS